MTAKTAFPLIAALVLAATTGLAAEHETVIQDPVTGERLERGGAGGDPPRARPRRGGGGNELEIEPRFSPEPLLPDRTFSFSKVERGGTDFIAVSETWKGAESGAAFSVSHAETGTSFTMGVSSGDVEVGPTSSFSQAISLPSVGESALFTSGMAESTDGLSTFSASAGAGEAITDGTGACA